MLMAAMQTTIIRASMTLYRRAMWAVLTLQQSYAERNKRPHGSLPFGTSLAIHGNGGPYGFVTRLTEFGVCLYLIKGW